MCKGVRNIECQSERESLRKGLARAPVDTKDQWREDEVVCARVADPGAGILHRRVVNRPGGWQGLEMGRGERTDEACAWFPCIHPTSFSPSLSLSLSFSVSLPVTSFYRNCTLGVGRRLISSEQRFYPLAGQFVARRIIRIISSRLYMYTFVYRYILLIDEGKAPDEMFQSDALFPAFQLRRPREYLVYKP